MSDVFPSGQGPGMEPEHDAHRFSNDGHGQNGANDFDPALPDGLKPAANPPDPLGRRPQFNPKAQSEQDDFAATEADPTDAEWDGAPDGLDGE